MQTYNPKLNIQGYNNIPRGQVANITLATSSGLFIVKPITTTSGYNFLAATKSESRILTEPTGEIENI